MPASYPSGTNTFVPSHEATGGLLVGFSRNQKDFPVNRYCQIYPVKKNVGVYASYTSRQAARIISPIDAEHLWADGEAAPVGFDQMDSFIFLTYQTSRRCYAFTVGDMAEDQAEWNLIAVESEGRAQQAMTARTMLVQAAIASAAWGTNSGTVSGGILPAGYYWDGGASAGIPSGGGLPTQANPFQVQNIYKSLQFGGKQVNLATIGAVKPKQLSLVVNVNTALRIGSSNEVLEYIKQSQFARDMMIGTAEWLNKAWDVPDTFHGFGVVVEDAVRVASKKGATNEILAYVQPDTLAILLAVPGKLEGLAGTRSYSTIQVFFYEDEMTVETMYDQPNRRTTARIVSNYQPVVATVLSGFKFDTFLNPALNI